MIGLSYALCGGVYAVVLAFVAVGVYRTMEKSSKIASGEAIHWGAWPSIARDCRRNSAAACAST